MSAVSFGEKNRSTERKKRDKEGLRERNPDHEFSLIKKDSLLNCEFREVMSVETEAERGKAASQLNRTGSFFWK